MAIIITRERPDSPDAAALIEELEAHLSPYSSEALSRRHTAREHTMVATDLNWEHTLEAAKSRAQHERKFVLADFSREH